MKRAASIYKRGSKYFIIPMCFTSVGIGIACGESAITENQQDISELLIGAFRQSKTQIPHPSEWKEFTRNFLSNFGVKTLAEFHKNTLLVTAIEEHGIITFTPHANFGAKRGFEGIEHHAVRVKDDAPQQVVTDALICAISHAS